LPITRYIAGWNGKASKFNGPVFGSGTRIAQSRNLTSLPLLKNRCWSVSFAISSVSGSAEAWIT
jgi:hypothetical protein